MLIIDAARLDEIVKTLISSPCHQFPADKQQAHEIPQSRGIYAIFLRDDIPDHEEMVRGRCLRAGSAGLMRHGHEGNLRKRIFDQHRGGGGIKARSDLIQNVLDRNYAHTRREARHWMEEHCCINWFEIPDDNNLLIWAEHRLLSVLQPIWGE
jgi:hypothetical protein